MHFIVSEQFNISLMKVKKCILFLILLISTAFCYAQNDSSLKTNSKQLKVAVFNKNFLNSKIDGKASTDSSKLKTIFKQENHHYSVVYCSTYNNSLVSGNDYNQYPRYSKYTRSDYKRSQNQIGTRYPITDPVQFSDNNAWGEFVAYTLYQILNTK